MAKDSGERSMGSSGSFFCLVPSSIRKGKHEEDEEKKDVIAYRKSCKAKGTGPVALHPDGQESQVMAPPKQAVGRPASGPFAGPLRRHRQRPDLPAHRHRPRRLRGRDRARHRLLGPGARGSKLAEVLADGELAQGLSPEGRPVRRRRCRRLRFGLKPSAVYFNPTERCNLNCTYCYIPEDMRRNGQHMSPRAAAGGPGASQRLFPHDACPRARCRRSSSTGPSRC